jgi:hypothetical protein
MSATLVSSNTTIKVNAAVSGSGTAGSGGNANIYTAPANGYAIVQVGVSTGGFGSWQVGGRAVAAGSTIHFYVGPNQTVTAINGSGFSNTAVCSGVEFINTP